MSTSTIVMPDDRLLSSEATDFVLRVLQQSPQPLGVTKLNKGISGRIEGDAPKNKSE
ncbi:MAG: hypothetical protein ACREV1_13105 [Gammaproteobacteria bacterium]